VLTLIAEHPLCNGDIKQHMRPYLEELTRELPSDTIEAVRKQVQTILETLRRSQTPTFLPEDYFYRLQGLLDDL
jgi:hypothetical protein